MKILVTGGGGFLGRHIVDRLLARGDAVTVLGRRDYPDLAARGVTCSQGDIADSAAVKTAAAGVDAVMHVASLAGIWGAYQTYYNTNVVGSENVLYAAKENGIDRIVYTSTPSVVHGGDGIDGGDESLPYPDHYLTPYAETKSIAEQLLLRANGPDLAVTAIRPHLIFGPGDTQLIPKLLDRAKTGKLKQIGDGKNLIGVSYVENVADAHILALDHLQPEKGSAGQAYFINEPEPVNCWRFINSLVRRAGMKEVARRVPFGLAYNAGWLCEKIWALLGRQDDPPVTRFLATQLATSHWFKTDKARQQLGWQSKHSLDEGVEKMLASMGYSKGKE
jgi:Nucleoside-diphosphate-sugar epimerases